MAYAASVVSSSIKGTTVRDIITANKFIKILKPKDVLSFPKIDDTSKVTLICFSDASFANLKCGGSQGGLLVFLEGSDRRNMLLAWQSQKLNWVVKSTLTAETLALQEVIEVAYMMSFTRNLKLEQQNQVLPIKCITDSKSSHDTVYSSKTLTEKRLKIELCATCESLDKGEIQSVTWVNSSDQLADCLTKEVKHLVKN